ncbi:MAG: triose-phosphate isomerase [Nitrospirota bacterium]
MPPSAAPPLIIANWKMHKTVAETVAAITALRGRPDLLAAVDVVLAPSATALDAARQAIAGDRIGLGAQTCHWEPDGAYTGELSVPQLADVGCGYCLVGHSERRQGFGETNDHARRKIAALLAAGLTPVLCVGETVAERRAGKTEQVVAEQVSIALQGLAADRVARVVVAYEPVWAIGSGKTATPAEVVTVHRFIRRLIVADHGDAAGALRILYGGSVSPETIGGLLEQSDINGALVGGASLKMTTFLAILERAAQRNSGPLPSASPRSTPTTARSFA